MDLHALTRELHIRNDSKIVMYVADGLGGLPQKPGGLTELETAKTTNLDKLAREGILGGASVKLTPNWVLHGAARYDLDSDRFDQTRIGVGYVDDCLILALNYITNYDYSADVQVDHRVLLQLSLRTIAGTSFSTGVGGLPGGL